MTKPGEAHARLQKLVGRWSGDETLFPAPWDPAGGPATAVVENRLVLNGLAVVQEYQQSRHGVNNFAGHAVFWWDPAARQHVMTWFDAMSGTATEYRGGFDGDVLRLAHAMPQGGHSRCSFNCGEPDQYAFRLEVSPDGTTWTPSMEGTYARVLAVAPRPSAVPSARQPRGRTKAATAAAAAKRSAAKSASPRVRATGPSRPRRVATRNGGKRAGRGGRRR